MDNVKEYVELVKAAWGKMFYDLIFMQLNIPQSPKINILDFGSGLGVTANHYAAWHDVTAVEPNEEMINNRHRKNFYTQVTGGVEKLAAFDDNKFDIIICHNVLESDLETAEFMFNGNRYSYVTFMCQQAIEKLAKGIYVYNFDKETKYTHNINIVLQDIENIVDSEEYKNYITFFNELLMYYTAGRYDVYKSAIAENLNKENTEEILNKAKGAFAWLKSQVIL